MTKLREESLDTVDKVKAYVAKHFPDKKFPGVIYVSSREFDALKRQTLERKQVLIVDGTLITVLGS